MARRNLILISVALCASASGQVINPPQWNSADQFLAGGLVRGSDGNYYRALHSTTNMNPVADNHSNWELYYVRANTVLDVEASGARFNSLKRAFAMVQSATVASPATVTIRIHSTRAYYVESFASEFSLNAESGKRITIVGDNASRVTLKFTNNTNGLVLSDGNTFGGVSAISILGPGVKTSTESGFSVSSSSILLAGTVKVSGFDTAFKISDHSFASLPSSSATNFTSYAVSCEDHSIATCQSFLADGGGTALHGLYATTSSQIDAHQASVKNLTGFAFACDFGSSVAARAASADHCHFGYYCDGFCTLDATVSAASSCYIGYYDSHGGRLAAQGATVSSNQSDFNIPINQLQSDQSFIAN